MTFFDILNEGNCVIRDDIVEARIFSSPSSALAKVAVLYEKMKKSHVAVFVDFRQPHEKPNFPIRAIKHILKSTRPDSEQREEWWQQVERASCCKGHKP